VFSRQQAVKNVFTNGIQFIITLIYGIFLPVLILKTIGKDQYSIWVLVMAYSGFIRLLDLGSFNALTRYLSHETHNKPEMYKYFSSLFIVILISLLVVMVLVLLIFPIFVTSMFPNLEYQDLNFIFTGFLLVASINLLTDVFANLLKAIHRFDLINYSVIIFSALNIITIPLFLHISNNLDALLYSFVFSSIIRFTYVIYSIYKSDLEFELFSIFYFNLGYFKKIFLLSSSDQWIRGIGVFWGTFIKYLIQKQFGSQYLVAYDLSMRVISQFSNFPNIVVSTLLPIFSSLNSQSEIDKIMSIIKKILWYLSLSILPIVIYLIIYSTEIVTIWTGKENDIISLTIVILVISSFINILTSPIYYATLAFEKPRPGIRKTLIAFLLNIMIVSISILMGMGYYGIIFAEFISTLISVYYFVHHFELDYKIRVMIPTLKGLSKILIYISPIILFFIFLKNEIANLDNIISLILTFLLYLFGVAVLYFKFKIVGKYEIELIKNNLLKKKGI